MVVARLGYAKQAETIEAEHECRIIMGNARDTRNEVRAKLAIMLRKLVVVIQRQQCGEWWELGELAGERVEEADSGALRLMEDQNNEPLRGDGQQLMVMKLWDVDLDALAGGYVEEAATFPHRKFLAEEDPPPGMEPAVQATLRARVDGAPSPRAAHSPKAHVVSNIVSKYTLRDQPYRPVI